MASKDDINNFALTADKITGSTFSASECNDIIKFLLAVKEYKGAYDQNQDLKKADESVFKNISLSDAGEQSIAGNIYIQINPANNQVVFYDKTDFKTGMQLPSIIAGRAAVIAGANEVSVNGTMNSNEYIFSAIVYGVDSEGNPVTDVATANPDDYDYENNIITVYSSIAGIMNYTLIEYF